MEEGCSQSTEVDVVAHSACSTSAGNTRHPTLIGTRCSAPFEARLRSLHHQTVSRLQLSYQAVSIYLLLCPLSVDL